MPVAESPDCECPVCGKQTRVVAFGGRCEPRGKSEKLFGTPDVGVRRSGTELVVNGESPVAPLLAKSCVAWGGYAALIGAGGFVAKVFWGIPKSGTLTEAAVVCVVGVGLLLLGHVIGHSTVNVPLERVEDSDPESVPRRLVIRPDKRGEHTLTVSEAYLAPGCHKSPSGATHFPVCRDAETVSRAVTTALQGERLEGGAVEEEISPSLPPPQPGVMGRAVAGRVAARRDMCACCGSAAQGGDYAFYYGKAPVGDKWRKVSPLWHPMARYAVDTMGIKGHATAFICDGCVKVFRTKVVASLVGCLTLAVALEYLGVLFQGRSPTNMSSPLYLAGSALLFVWVVNRPAAFSAWARAGNLFAARAKRADYRLMGHDEVFYAGANSDPTASWISAWDGRTTVRALETKRDDVPGAGSPVSGDVKFALIVIEAQHDSPVVVGQVVAQHTDIGTGAMISTVNGNPRSNDGILLALLANYDATHKTDWLTHEHHFLRGSLGLTDYALIKAY